jgi:hypothetical protein
VRGFAGRRRHLLLIATGAVAALALALFQTATEARPLADELWFLQLISRVSDGEVLYRDVSFSPTPLSVWIGAAAATVFGVSGLTVKALVAGALTGIAFMCASTVRALGMSWPAAAALVVAVLLIPGPSPDSAYSWVASLFLLVALRASIGYLQAEERARAVSSGLRRSLAWAALAGAAGGLCFGAKQNFGAAAALGIAVTIAVAAWSSGPGRRHVVSAGAAMAAYVAAVAAVLAPVVWSGGWSEFVEYGFHQGEYLEVAHISYTTQLTTIADRFGDLFSNPGFGALRAAVGSLQALIPLASLLLLATAVVASAGARRRALMVVVAFVVAGMASALYPRADSVHLAYALPYALLGLWAGAHQLVRRERWSAGRGIATAGVLAATLGVTVGHRLEDMARGQLAASDLPNYRGVFVDEEWSATVLDDARRLAAARREHGPLFILSPSAPIGYVLSGIPNPTPYDYPLANGFGEEGEGELIREIRRGDLRNVCVGEFPDEKLRPDRLHRSVRRLTTPAERLESCVLHIRRPDPATPQ